MALGIAPDAIDGVCSVPNVIDVNDVHPINAPLAIAVQLLRFRLVNELQF